MDKRKKGKAEFFGFPLTKGGAQIVYILGVLLLIGTSLSFLWLVYSAFTAYMLFQTYVLEGYAGYYAFSLWNWIPWLVVEIAMMILAIYMMQCGKKGM